MISLPSQLILILLSLLRLSEQRLEDTTVQVLYGWKFPDWLYPSDEFERTAKERGQFVPSNAAILDSDFYFCEYISPPPPHPLRLSLDRSFCFTLAHSTSLRRVFVSTPQFRSGIPATLSEVTRLHRNGSYALRPFPDWGAQNRSNCANLISVNRFHVSLLVRVRGQSPPTMLNIPNQCVFLDRQMRCLMGPGFRPRGPVYEH